MMHNEVSWSWRRWIVAIGTSMSDSDYPLYFFLGVGPFLWRVYRTPEFGGVVTEVDWEKKRIVFDDVGGA